MLSSWGSFSSALAVVGERKLVCHSRTCAETSDGSAIPVGLIVNDQDLVGHVGASFAAAAFFGRRIIKAAYSPSLVSTRSSPWWPRTAVS